MEQRKHPRFAVRFPVSFAEEQIEGDGLAWNLSTSGCAVECETIVAIGTYVKMLLCLLEESAPIVIDVAAVRWSNAQGFGAEFMGMSVDDQQRLQRFIAGLNQKV
ncbi:MAG: PilZ domain-containing protein [Nitrospiraceae bacterium]